MIYEDLVIENKRLRESFRIIHAYFTDHVKSVDLNGVILRVIDICKQNGGEENEHLPT